MGNDHKSWLSNSMLLLSGEFHNSVLLFKEEIPNKENYTMNFPFNSSVKYKREFLQNKCFS